MDEIAKKRFKTLYFNYLAAVLLIFVITVLVELSRPRRFAAIGPPPFEPQPLKLGNLCTPCDAVPMPDMENGYRIAVKYRNADGILVLHIVLGPRFRIGPEGFTALACELRKDFGAKSDVFVRVFDNKDAAKKYVDPSARHKPRDWQLYPKSFKAFYTWEPTANQNIVAWNFDPLNPYSDGARRTVADLCPTR
jgi:hypothetical protein